MSNLETALRKLADLDAAITHGTDQTVPQAALDEAVAALDHDEFLDYVSAAVARTYPEPATPAKRRSLSPEIASALTRNRSQAASTSIEI